MLNSFVKFLKIPTNSERHNVTQTNQFPHMHMYAYMYTIHVPMYRPINLLNKRPTDMSYPVKEINQAQQLSHLQVATFKKIPFTSWKINEVKSVLIISCKKTHNH